METTKIPRLFVSKVDAAEALAVSLRTIENLIACGELRARKVGRRTLIAIGELERFARRDHKTRVSPEGHDEGA